MIFFWIAYFIFYSLMMGAQIIYFFAPGSQEGLYYHYMISMDTRFIFFYTMNAAVVLLNLLSTVPLYLYIFRIKFLNKGFWQGFFLLRLFMEIPGRMYEMSVVKSLLVQDPHYAYITIGVFLLLHSFCYIAMYNYIFNVLND